MNARGDVILKADVREGEAPRAYTLALTLGAMAEIETALGCANMTEVMARLRPDGGSPSMNDLVSVLTALIRAGGHDVTADDVRAERFSLAAAGSAIGVVFSAATEHSEPEAGGKPSARPPRRTGPAGSTRASSTSV